MRRVILVNNAYGSQDKYILHNEYEGFGVYMEKTPSGYFVNQSWLITDGKVTLIVPSYANVCNEELLDYIDTYRGTGKFGIKAINHGCGNYIAHNCGVET